MKAFLLGFISVIFSAIATAEDIAYLSYADNFWQVFVMDDQGGNQRQVSFSNYDKIKISWYPDGKHLLVNGSQGEVVKLNIQNQQEMPINIPLPNIADAVISPDAKNIAFSLSASGPLDRNDLWLIDVNGNNLKKLTSMKGLQHEPVWSHDGSKLYFLSGITGAQKQHHDIYRYDVKNGNITQITAASLFHFDIAVNSRGEFVYSNNKTGNYEIWKNINGKLLQLTDHHAIDAKPSWSPDKRSIVFESARSGRNNIWKMNANGEGLVQLTQAVVGARYPVWFAGVQQ